jgi:hypothetical protein
MRPAPQETRTYRVTALTAHSRALKSASLLNRPSTAETMRGLKRSLPQADSSIANCMAVEYVE